MRTCEQCGKIISDDDCWYEGEDGLILCLVCDADEAAITPRQEDDIDDGPDWHQIEGSDRRDDEPA